MHARRLALVGLLVGVGLPLLATAVEAAFRFAGDPLAAQRGSPLLWIIDTAPAVVAFLAWLVGRRQDQVEELEAARAAGAVRTADELSTTATALFQAVSAFSAMTSQTAASVQETTHTMAALSQTAMRAALGAETVVGQAQRAARSAEEGARTVEQAGGAATKLAGDVQAWVARAEALATALGELGDLAGILIELGEHHQALAEEAGAAAVRDGGPAADLGGLAARMRDHAGLAQRAAAQVRTVLQGAERTLAPTLAAMEGGRREAAATAASAGASGQSLRGLAGTLQESSQAAREIAAVAQQQDRGIEETLKAMNAIYLAVQDAMRQTGQVAAQARALSDLAASLKTQVQTQAQARGPRP